MKSPHPSKDRREEKDGGFRFPLGEIARESGRSVQECKTAIRELERRGILQVERRQGKENRYYIIDPKALQELLGEEEEAKPVEAEKVPENKPPNSPSPKRRNGSLLGRPREEDGWIVIRRG